MAETVLIPAEGYVLQKVRIKRLSSKNIIVSDHGPWCVLDDEQWDRVLNNALLPSEPLFADLEKKGIILTENNQGMATSQYKERYSHLFIGPSLHILVITKRCNHKCVYCHMSAARGDMAEFDMGKETARKTVDFIFKSPTPTLHIEFQGGESLMNFDVIKEVVLYAEKVNETKKRTLEFSLVSNLSLMDEEKLMFLLDHHVHICTSLDGTEEIHNHNRRSELRGFNSFATTKRWIDRIRAEYQKLGSDRDVSALITINRNAIDKAKEDIDAYRKCGFSMIHLRSLNNLGFASRSWHKIGYSAEEFIRFWQEGIEYIIGLNKKGEFFRERTAIIVLQKMLTTINPNYVDLSSPCGACVSVLTYDYNGKIYSCDEGRMVGDDTFCLGEIQDEFKDLMGSKKACAIVTSSINDLSFCDECAWKPYCGLCPVHTYQQSNSLVPLNIQDDRCKILMAQFDFLMEKLVTDDAFAVLARRWVSAGLPKELRGCR